ncbi:MAG: chemotaxis response regulator protein-glutamate methylesterase [Nitrospirae bacterium]|nr:chemotaxis response regulator protein-glutamate methylesterase [Nitrospirota bacterium]
MHGKGPKPIRVLIIDDSAFNRQTIKRMLEKSSAIEVAGVAVDGYDGMKKVMKLKPDVITLDLEMPRVDGFTLLRWLMEENPLPVIIVSSHGEKSTVFKALELGAVDFIVKPTKSASKELESIESDLLRKVLSITSLNMDKLRKNISWIGYKDAVMPESHGRFEDEDIEIVTIGASTGGPAALQVVLSMLPGNFPSPILISQHMPYGFTRQFASRINKVSALTVKEAEHGEAVETGKALICPGGHHMILNRTRGETVVTIKNSTEDDIYIPSIDMMMMSAAETFGAKTIGIVLTGMGSDGKAGMKEIKRRGGFTIAESEESAVIFGMPNEVISIGAADMIAPLQQIPAEILKRFKSQE